MPPELGGTSQIELPAAAALVLVQRSNGWFLYRYAEDGTFVGDTWDMTVEGSKEQALFEYGNALTKWHELDLPEEELLEFVLSQLRQSA